MADNNEYVLNINITDTVGDDSPISNGENTKKPKKPKKPKETPEEKLSYLVAHNLSSTFVSASKQLIMNNVNTSIGNNELQQRIDFCLSMAQKGISNITGGIALAKTIGIKVGTGIMTTVLLSAISFGANVIVNQSAISNKAKIENEYLQVLRGRMGVQFNKSRSGE